MCKSNSSNDTEVQDWNRNIFTIIFLRFFSLMCLFNQIFYGKNNQYILRHFETDSDNFQNVIGGFD